MLQLRLTCLCGCCQSPGVRRDWTESITLDTYQRTGSALLCTVQLAALSSSPLSLGRHHHQLSLCRLSPVSASHTYCSSSSSSINRGKAGGCRLCVQSLSLSPTLSLCLSLSSRLCVSPQVWLQATAAEEMNRKKISGQSVYGLSWLPVFASYVRSVFLCDKKTACSDNNNAHRRTSLWERALLPPPAPSLFFFTTTYPNQPPTQPFPLPGPHQPVEVSHQRSANRAAAHSLWLE